MEQNPLITAVMATLESHIEGIVTRILSKNAALQDMLNAETIKALVEKALVEKALVDNRPRNASGLLVSTVPVIFATQGWVREELGRAMQDSPPRPGFVKSLGESKTPAPTRTGSLKRSTPCCPTTTATSTMTTS